MVELYFQTLRPYANDAHLNSPIVIHVNVNSEFFSSHSCKCKILAMTSSNFLNACKQYS